MVGWFWGFDGWVVLGDWGDFGGFGWVIRIGDLDELVGWVIG